MRKWHKCLIGVISVTVFASAAVYAVKGDAILKFLYGGRHNPEVEMQEIPELDEEKQETIKYNGMTIKMVKCVFDSESTFGYSEFDIEREGGFTEEMYGNDAFSDGENWYQLSRLATGGREYNTELNDDGTLHVAYSYNGIGLKDKEDFIGLYNSVNMLEPVASFVLSDKYKPDEVLHISDDILAVITPLGICVQDIKLSWEDSIIMKYADGTEKEVKVTGISSVSGEDTSQIRFDEYTQINGMKSLIINGKEYFTE